MATTIQLKRKISGSAWNGILNEGEPIFDITKNELYIGDGSHTLSALSPLRIGQTSIKSNTINTTITSHAGGVGHSLTITGGPCTINASSVVRSSVDSVYIRDVSSDTETLTISGRKSNNELIVDGATSLNFIGDETNDLLTIKADSGDEPYAVLSVKGNTSISSASISNLDISETANGILFEGKNEFSWFHVEGPVQLYNGDTLTAHTLYVNGEELRTPNDMGSNGSVLVSRGSSIDPVWHETSFDRYSYNVNGGRSYRLSFDSVDGVSLYGIAGNYMLHVETVPSGGGRISVLENVVEFTSDGKIISPSILSTIYMSLGSTYNDSNNPTTPTGLVYLHCFYDSTEMKWATEVCIDGTDIFNAIIIKKLL